MSRNGGKQLVGELALLGGYQRVRFGSIGHITIRVADIDRSLAFYVGKFGFRKRFRLYRDGLFMPLGLGGAENKHAWVKDLDGHRIEPMQMATDSKPALAVAALKGMKDEGAAHNGGKFSEEPAKFSSASRTPLTKA